MSKKYQVIRLGKEDAEDISALFKEVWLKSYEYPEEWRKKRTMSAEEIKKEMNHGYYYFGIRVEGKLVGAYKALITKRGCLGEQQAVLPEYCYKGVASTMYEQFFEFAKEKKCKVNYVNILVGQKSGEKMMKKFNFYKTGEQWEQIPGMWVQTYERKID